MILDITGSIKYTIYKLDGKEVTKEEEAKIVSQLNEGELYFSLGSAQIVDTDFEKVFTLEFEEVLVNTEYNFEVSE